MNSEPNILYNAAQDYLRAGLCVLPAHLVEKRPAVGQWKPFQHRLPTSDELSAWMADGRSTGDAICIVCGAVSGNTEMIDFDAGGELFHAWLARVEILSPGLTARLVFEQSQRKGFHVVYRCVECVCGNMKLAQRRGDDGQIHTLIETRGEGGLFLCAPSPGYELLRGDFTELPVLTAEERNIFLSAAWELNEYMPPVADAPPAPSPAVSSSSPSPVSSPASSSPVRGVSLVGHIGEPSAPSLRPGDDFNARGDVRAVLQQHGWVRVRDGENEHWRRPGKTAGGLSATLRNKDNVFYVFSSNAAPFEPNHAYSPFSVYTLLEHGGDFAQAASALRGLGYGAAMTPSPAVSTGHSAVASSTVAGPPPVTPTRRTSRAKNVYGLIDTFPGLRRPVIHGLLREGETMNVISAPKMGKSWLVTDLALSIATGRDWLGFRCERGDVLILDNELHGETSADRIPKVGTARKLELDAYAAHVWVENLRGELMDVFSLGDYFQSISRGQYKVIILDAFYRFMPCNMDENDNGTMSSLYNHIDRYANDLGCSFVLIHHSTKGNQSAKSVTDVGAGAGSQSRATDTHLVIRPHEEAGTVVLDAAVRSWPPCQPRCLRWAFPVWQPADELDPTQLKNDNGRKRPERPAKKDEWTPETFAMEFVGAKPEGRSAILSRATDAGLSESLAYRLLREADADGLVICEGEGTRGRPFLYKRHLPL